MHELTAEQQKQKDKVRTGATVSGVLLAIVVAFMTHFATPAMEPVMRWPLIAVLAAGLGYLAYRTSYSNGVAKAKCAKCGTPFSIREVERRETLLGNEQRRQVEQIKPATKLDRGIDRVTTWTEEKVEITAVDECMKCHDRNERTWVMTRDKDKVEEEVPT
jgi:hypothetical protein